MESPEAAVPGRRERKKAATRQALADAALRLFLARGFDDVTVREIADAADVSTTTLLAYFPNKEALVFDRDTEIETAMVEAVRGRPAGTSIPRALQDYLVAARRAQAGTPGGREFLGLVQSTPALRRHWHEMWMRHREGVAHAIAAEVGAPPEDPRCAALAHLALETSALAARAPDPVVAPRGRPSMRGPADDVSAL